MELAAVWLCQFLARFAVGAGHYIQTVFFDVFDDGENPSQPLFDVCGEVHWIETAAGGAKLDLGFLADFGAG